MGTYSNLLKQKPAKSVTTPSSQTIYPRIDNSIKTERNSARSEFRTEIRTDQLPIKRRTKRYSFEFYDDQIMQLKKLKRQAEDRDENLSLSDMAREAFDKYLSDKTG